ncbi:hypothetical protein NST44_05365 [Paenibacillus sp. FSL W8-0919]|uniref:hypothetical protein n=1 Tax=Paenibacillus sp. FSL W8-0919 TaxID=2954707 RepID=UPI0030FBA3A2
MKYESNEQIRSSIDELTERLRQIRIEQGLPPEAKPRPKVVDIALSHAIIERLEPFKAIVIRYASLLAQGQFTRIDVEKLTKYEGYFHLLGKSKGFFSAMYGWGAYSALEAIKRINDAIDSGSTDTVSPTEEVRNLHYCIGFMIKDSGIRGEAYDYRKATGENVKGKYDHEAEFQAALTAALVKEEELSYE